MHAKLYSLAAAICACGFPLPARADLIITGSHTDHDIVPGGALSHVRLRVSLSVAGGTAVMTFTNVSVAPEASAVVKEIVVDAHDDDTGQTLLWNGSVLTDTPDVGYTIGLSDGLPGYHALTSEDVPLIELRARPAITKKGLGPRESLRVRFDTILADGADVNDYMACFAGGADTPVAAIGFHAISADVLSGQSLSGVYVPEPAAMSVLGLGGLVVLRRRR